MADLKPANENPWYVLATLYGEQKGEEIDWELHEENRKVWNAWAGQALSEEEIVEAAKSSGIEEAELRAWPDMREEIEARHWEVMAERNGEGFAYLGFPLATQEIGLINTSFTHVAVWAGCVFATGLHCVSATFRKEAWFSATTFRTAATFKSSSFNDDASFASAKFRGNVSFNSVRFFAAASFNFAKFDATVDYFSTTFNASALFAYAVFGNYVSFSTAKFNAVSNFASVTFNSVANFDLVCFAADVEFSSTIFKSFSHFSLAVFGDLDGSTNCKPIFHDCQFEKPTSFRMAMFRNSYPDFSGAVLHDKTTFTAKKEFWPEAKTQQFEDSGQRLLWIEDSKASCATIRHVLGQQGLPEEEHFFFRREMGFAGQVGSWWARVPYRLFGLVSDYGISIARPLLWLLALWVVPPLIYLLGYAWTDVFAGRAWRMVEPFSFSFANIFKVFGFQRLYFGAEYMKELPMWMQGLSGLQTVLGFALLFFLGLGLRQRFRLR